MTGLFSRVKSAGLDRFGFHVSVADLRQPAAGFVLVTLAGPALTEHEWQPGDRISLRTPEDELRNYTPFDWDRNAGRVRLLGVGLASGPGTRYLSALTVGAPVQLLGPKRSVKLDFAHAPIIVGDETVLGLCAAWNGAHPQEPATVLLEAADKDRCEAAAQAIGVVPTHVVGDRDALVATVLDAIRADPAAPLVLSGRAQTIATIRRAVKAAGLNQGATTVRAYWDENRAGLD